jgi:multimeric flavodoxin WrbA
LNVLGMDVGSVTSMGTPSGEMLTIMHRVLNPM